VHELLLNEVLIGAEQLDFPMLAVEGVRGEPPFTINSGEDGWLDWVGGMEGRTDANAEPVIYTVYEYLLAKGASASAMRSDWPEGPSPA
jgi:hypothetical protein